MKSDRSVCGYYTILWGLEQLNFQLFSRKNLNRIDQEILKSEGYLLIPVIVIGEEPQIKSELIRYFSEKQSVIVSENAVLVSGCDYLLISDSHLVETHMKSGIIVFLPQQIPGEELMIPSGFTGICESRNKPALELLMENEIPTVTCGLSATDTVTVSSMEQNQFQISLQREIEDLTGNPIEPFEFLSTLPCSHPLSQLFLNAIRMLCGECRDGI